MKHCDLLHSALPYFAIWHLGVFFNWVMKEVHWWTWTGARELSLVASENSSPIRVALRIPSSRNALCLWDAAMRVWAPFCLVHIVLNYVFSFQRNMWQLQSFSIPPVTHVSLHIAFRWVKIINELFWGLFFSKCLPLYSFHECLYGEVRIRTIS